MPAREEKVAASAEKENKATTFEEVLDREGKLIYTNKGVSMMPLLREDRDILVIEKVDGAECQLLDAVLFRRPWKKGRGEYVLHRILKENADGTFWIVGDNCISGENVQKEFILGRLTAVIRDGKTVNVTDKDYLRYVHLWCDHYKIRFFLLRVRAFVMRILRAVWRRIRPFVKRS